jgi:hypothetical protein
MGASIPSGNPWTAIILLNEEYFIALREQQQMRDHPLLKKLPITRIVGRKVHYGDWYELSPHDPWESFAEQEVKSLIFDYNAEDYGNAYFDIQKHATVNKMRGFGAVFIDYIELYFDSLQGFEKYFPFKVHFKLGRPVKGSQTYRQIQTLIKAYAQKYGLYEEWRKSKIGEKEYRKLLARPSCLEIFKVEQASPNPNIRMLKDVSSTYLDGLTQKSQDFLLQLEINTNQVISAAYKVPSTTKGFVLDGLVSQITI